MIAEPSEGIERRVATHVQAKSNLKRESRLFVERSPPGMEWFEKVFDLIRGTGKLSVFSGGLHEIRIDCEDQLEILEDEPALIDRCESKVYFDDGAAGQSTSLYEGKIGFWSTQASIHTETKYKKLFTQ